MSFCFGRCGATPPFDRLGNGSLGFCPVAGTLGECLVLCVERRLPFRGRLGIRRGSRVAASDHQDPRVHRRKVKIFNVRGTNRFIVMGPILPHVFGVVSIWLEIGNYEKLA